MVPEKNAGLMTILCPFIPGMKRRLDRKLLSQEGSVLLRFRRIGGPQTKGENCLSNCRSLRSDRSCFVKIVTCQKAREKENKSSSDQKHELHDNWGRGNTSAIFSAQIFDSHTPVTIDLESPRLGSSHCCFVVWLCENPVRKIADAMLIHAFPPCKVFGKKQLHPIAWYSHISYLMWHQRGILYRYQHSFHLFPPLRHCHFPPSLADSPNIYLSGDNARWKSPVAIQ